VANLKAGGMGALGKDQLDWLEDDLRGRSASTPIVVFAHIPLWAVYPQWGWGTQDSAEALSYLKRFGSVTVLNGHIHQIMQKVEGNVSFHTAMATAFPQPVPGTAPSPGPLTVPADKLRRVLGITNVNYIAGGHQLAVLDSTLAGTPAEESIEILGAAAATTSQAQPQPAANAQAPAAAPASSPSVSGEVVQVSIDNFAFTPRTLTMRKGTSVAWTNHDVALPTGLLA
jgi:Icc protein